MRGRPAAATRIDLTEVYVQGASHELRRAGPLLWRCLRAPLKPGPKYVDCLSADLLHTRVPGWACALTDCKATVLQPVCREGDGWWYPLLEVGLEFKPKSAFVQGPVWAQSCRRLLRNLNGGGAKPAAMREFLADLSKLGRVRATDDGLLLDDALLARLADVVALLTPFTALSARLANRALQLYQQLGEPVEIDLNIPTFIDLEDSGDIDCRRYCSPQHLCKVRNCMQAQSDSLCFLECFLVGKVMSDCSLVVESSTKHIYIIDTGSKLNLVEKFRKWAHVCEFDFEKVL